MCAGAMFFGGLNSLLSYFIDYTFWQGSIFENYLPWLAKKNLKFFRPAKYELLMQRKDHLEFDNDLIKAAADMFFFKILGGCVICTNIWLGGITFTILNLLLLSISWWCVIPYLIFSSFLLRKIAA